jgi:hypothetical protein
LLFPKKRYLCLVNPGEIGLMKKAHFSLYSEDSELGQLTLRIGIKEIVLPLVCNRYCTITSCGAIVLLYFVLMGVQAQLSQNRAKMKGSTFFYFHFAHLSRWGNKKLLPMTDLGI